MAFTNYYDPKTNMEVTIDSKSGEFIGNAPAKAGSKNLPIYNSNNVYNYAGDKTSTVYNPNATAKDKNTIYSSNVLGTRDYSGLYNKVTDPTSTVDYMKKLEADRQAKEAEERRKLISATKKSYDPFFSDLKNQEAQIPDIQNEMLGNVNTGYQNQTDVINRGREAGINQADASATEVKQNQATSLRDLGLNLGNAVSAFGRKLGAMGAGNSSAANMANYAYSKIANRNTADIMNQTRSKLAEIETAKQTIVNDAQDKLSALETWKSDQSLAVSNYVRSLKDYISKAKSQGKMALAENEVSAIRDGFNRAMQIAQQINATAVQSRAAILQNAQQALANAQSTASQLSTMGDIQVDPITGLPIDAGTIAGQTTGAAPVYGTADTSNESKSLWDMILNSGAIGTNLLPR